MGLAERVLIRAPAPVEQRALQVTPWGDWHGSHASAAGINVTPDSAVQLLTVYGCVTLISDTIATLPRKIYRTQDGLDLEVVNKPRWFEQPNATTDIIDFVTQTLTSLLLDGNAYWVYRLDGNFLPSELSVLNPADVDIRDDGYYVRGERFVGRLLHLKGATRPGCRKGMAPLEAARQSIGLGLAAQEFASRFYSNGTTLSGVIQLPGKLDPGDAKIMRDTFARDHSGVSQAHLPGVLTGGATWQQISVTPEQAQFLQSREFQAAEICSQMFLMDPSMLGIATSGAHGTSITYANLEQRGIHLVQFTLLRWIIRLERAFSYLLPAPQRMKFNVDGLQRADLKTRMESHRIALGPTQPFETVDEARGFENLPPMGGAHSSIAEPAAPTPPPPPPAPPEPQTNNITVNVPEQPAAVIRFEPTINVPPLEPAATIVHVAAAEAPVVNVDVNPTPIEVHPAVVNVAAAEAPTVNIDVQPADVRVDVNPTPVTVDVAPTPINVEPAVTNVHIAPAENRIEVNPTPIENYIEVEAAQAPNVTVEAAQITVNQPEIRVEPTPVTIENTVERSDVYVDAPNVTVESPTVHVRPAPPPAIRIAAPVINLPKPGAIRRRFERDENDAILAIIEEPIEEEAEVASPEGTDQ